ncbi:hypothetical protein HK100_001589 [Physocladia obscura]|uniref:Uncharacterized protein n=1 Tax=Physocladia obscura TaxID=109957 RepID=A0AAD5SWK0_9FUNG|nr:hypothetical protein HK100_001589 [Physocladia obscura]
MAPPLLSAKNIETLDKLCRFLSSVRGTDKVLMLYSYVSKIAIARLQARDPKSVLATRLRNFAIPVGDTRMLLRYYGLIPLFQWIIFSERNPPPTPFLRLVYRLQNLANLAYYPLEHVYYLASHKVINLTEETTNKIGMWSCRFWAAYVILYFLQLHQEHRLLEMRQLQLTQRSRGNSEPKEILRAEQKSIANDVEGLLVNTIINTAYFPLTLHWSVENSSFPEIGVGLCGSVAAKNSFELMGVQSEEHQQQPFLLRRCVRVLKRRESSAEERMAALTVVNRVLTLGMTAELKRNSQSRLSLKLAELKSDLQSPIDQEQESQLALYSTLASAIFVTNARFIRRMLLPAAAAGLQATVLSLTRIFSALLFTNSDPKHNLNINTECINGLLSLALPFVKLLVSDSDPDSDNDGIICDILSQFTVHKYGILKILDPDIISMLLQIATDVHKKKQYDGILDSKTSRNNGVSCENSSHTFVSPVFLLLRQLISSVELFTQSFTSSDIKFVKDAMMHLVKEVSRFFDEAGNAGSVKFDFMRLLITILIVCDELNVFEKHNAKDNAWNIHIRNGLFDVIQSRLSDEDRISALILASSTFQTVGPTWLFPTLSLSSPLSQSVLIDHPKFATLLVSLTCIDLRVRLDESNPETNTSPSHETSDNKASGSHDVSATISYLSLLANAIKAIVQTFPDSEDNIEGTMNSTDPIKSFPHNLLISLHHALAEVFVAVLAYLVDLHEIYANNRGNVGEFVGSEKSGVIRAAIVAIGVWLSEDSDAANVPEVCAGMDVLVTVVREVGFSDLGGFLIHVTAQENNDSNNEGLDLSENSWGEKDVESGGGNNSGGNAKKRFKECGGVDMLVDWVLFFEDKTGGGLEEMRMAVCCLLNLVVADGVKILASSTVNAGDVGWQIVEKCLLTDLKSGFQEDDAVHVMNACCLSLFILKDVDETSFSRENANKTAKSAIIVLYESRKLEHTGSDLWNQISELWFLATNGV